MNNSEVDLRIEDGVPGESEAETDTQQNVIDTWPVERNEGGYSVAGSGGSSCSGGGGSKNLEE